MYNMDLENGGGALNQEEEAGGGGGHLVTPDPAADYLSTGQIAFECVVAVMWLSLGALLLGLAVSHSVSHWAVFVAYMAGGGVALAVGCGGFAILCCLGSNSKLWGLG
jgi:hypothetical protein